MISFYTIARFFCFLLLQVHLFSGQVIPIAVVGSGPAGLSAALVTGRSGYETHLFLGGQPGGPLSSKAKINNWPGSVKEAPIVPRLMDQLDLPMVTMHSDSIVKADLSSHPFTLQTESGKTYQAQTVIITTGSVSTKLQVAGADRYLKKDNAQDVVAIVGGGDDAANKALKAANMAKKVYILVRGNKLAKAEKIAARENIQVLYQTEIQEIVGNGKKMTGLILKNGQHLSASDVMMAVGVEPNTRVFEKDLALDENGIILLEGRTQKTSIPGVFAAGGVTDRRYQKAITSAGDGTKAGLDAIEFLRN
ncbi:MAG: FAD-dependent oxidoreductase [Simkaniaceae bacterium]|nr:FAD-dependent oxidoreductase [Candidatus Sacchlamyda saccharinae]